MASDVQVCGTDWCGITFRVREYLINSKIEYEYHDIERDPAAQEFVLAMNEGRRLFPLVVVEGRVMTRPTLAELQNALENHGIRPGRSPHGSSSEGVGLATRSRPR
ncbi:MAG TPA: glutaredoxin domain-containing protein [Vicinamibacterales bacterium]|jgi:glutaredoxin|nr:glutaredoxin domain-containing protein [Vicinamibacterales bacterium]